MQLFCGTVWGRRWPCWNTLGQGKSGEQQEWCQGEGGGKTLVKQLMKETKSKNLVLMGDFNYCDVYWESKTISQIMKALPMAWWDWLYGLWEAKQALAWFGPAWEPQGP